jgi:hypothetical protein
MTDPRCIAGLHHYPKPGKDHPVSAAEAAAGQVTLECSRCHKTKTIQWKAGPPKPDNDPPMGFG